MKLHDLKMASRPNPKRVGRGIGSGYGKTSGRGTKGQGARSGGLKGATFEGGQNSLVHRLPKLRGFTSKRPDAQIIYTDQLNSFNNNSKLSTADLLNAKLIFDTKRPVRLLKRGPLTKKVSLEIQGASSTATEMITKMGGSIINPQATKSDPKAR